MFSAWFKDNFMKMNLEKCKVITLGEQTILESFSVEIDNILRQLVPEVTPLGITADNKESMGLHSCLLSLVLISCKNCRY